VRLPLAQQVLGAAAKIRHGAGLLPGVDLMNQFRQEFTDKNSLNRSVKVRLFNAINLMNYAL
jgi:hypothetical protein